MEKELWKKVGSAIVLLFVIGAGTISLIENFNPVMLVLVGFAAWLLYKDVIMAFVQKEKYLAQEESKRLSNWFKALPLPDKQNIVKNYEQIKEVEK